MSNNPISYNLNRAAELTGVSKTTLYKAIKDGRLTKKKWGTRTLVLHDELVELIKNTETNV